jgi:hypothetical protein
MQGRGSPARDEAAQARRVVLLPLAALLLRGNTERATRSRIQAKAQAAGAYTGRLANSCESLLASAERPYCPLGVLDGPGVVAEEELGHRAPAGPFLHGVGYDFCLAGRLALAANGVSHCRGYDHARANRTDYECHDEAPHALHRLTSVPG